MGALQFNMLALWSFGHVAAKELGRDQFLAYYVSAGVLASLASHLATVGFLCGSELPQSVAQVVSCWWSSLLATSMPAAMVLSSVQAIGPWLHRLKHHSCMLWCSAGRPFGC